MKPSKTSELYIENETFSENGENDHISATETNGKYDNCENDFEKTENSLVASTDSLDGELGDEEEDDEEEVVKVSTDPAASDLAVLLREGNRQVSSEIHNQGDTANMRPQAAGNCGGNEPSAQQHRQRTGQLED